MSVTLDPTAPADAESPRQGASRIRGLTLELLQLLTQGGGGAVTFANPPFSIDTSGNVTIPTTIVVPTPTAAGQAATKAYVDAVKPGAVTFTGVAAGTNNYTVALAPSPASLSALQGIPIYVQFTNANTNVSTLNVNSLGAKPLSGGRIVAGKYYALIYDGTKFENLERIGSVARTATQAVTGTTLVNDNTLFFPIAINETLTFTLCCSFTRTGISSDTLKIQINAPTGATGFYTEPGIEVNSPLNTSISSNTTNPSAIVVQGMVTSDGSHTGLVQLQFASTSQAGTTWTNNIGSYLNTTRVSA